MIIKKIKEVKSILESKGFTVAVEQYLKNGFVVTGLILQKEESLVNPTFYVDEWWETQDSMTIATSLIEEYEKNPNPNINMVDYTTPEYLRKHVKLCVQKNVPKKCAEAVFNGGYLKKAYLDLEIYIRCFINETSSFIVSKEMDFDGLWDVAYNNTKHDFFIRDMNNICGFPDIFRVPLYICTNANIYFGAAAMYFPEIFQKYCRDAQIESCYIIPSSIHEVLILPKKNKNTDDIDSLNDIITQVNQLIDKSDYLSNHVYLYSLKENQVSIPKL